MIERSVMRKPRHWPLLASLCLTASLLLPTPTASAAESIPELQYPAIPSGRRDGMVSGPNGTLTLPCNNLDAGVDLVTYDNTGAVVRKIDRTQAIDGVKNCINKPVVDKNGTLYGLPYGKMVNSNTSTWGPNLLAYSGNDLKWKYPVYCGSNNTPVAVGANGNIYSTQYMSDGVHLIGLTPEVAPGQTQPAKVLDVKIANDCSVEFFPYRDGLLLRGQNSGFKYYSYAGKLLAQPQVNQFWDAKLGAQGELFDYKFVSGNSTSASISMFDSLTGQTIWTTSASTPGANVQAVSLYPLSGRGVAALIKEQKMVSDGIPATPASYIFKLAILNSAGQKGSAVEVPSTDAGNVLYNHRVVSSDSGKLAIASDVELRPSSVSAISIRVFDVATGSWTFQKLMSGDANKPGGPTGFYLDRGPAVGDNTLFLIGQCSGNCAVYQEKKLYAIKVPMDLGVEYPRGTVLEANTPAQPEPVPYVAMGDSYSAGQGAFVYDGGTTTTNRCYKSANAYGRLLHLNPTSPFSLGGFVACGGAIASDIYETKTYPGVYPQVTALTDQNRLVTITIGGNDIQFANAIITCADPTKACDGAIGLSRNNLAILEVNLQKAYISILQKAPQAKVYVLGYPPIIATGSGCLVGSDGSDYPFFSEERKQKAVDLLNDLNKTISDNVEVVKKLPIAHQRIHYVDATAIDSPLSGHDVCAPEPFMHGLRILPDDSSESFHPNIKGQSGYARLVMENLN